MIISNKKFARLAASAITAIMIAASLSTAVASGRPIASNNKPEKTTGFVKLDKVVTTTSVPNVWKVVLKVQGKVKPPVYKDVLFALETSEQMATDKLTASLNTKWTSVKENTKQAIGILHNRARGDKQYKYSNSKNELLYTNDPITGVARADDAFYRNIKAQIFRSGIVFFGQEAFSLDGVNGGILHADGLTIAANATAPSGTAITPVTPTQYAGFENLMGDGGLKSVIGGKIDNVKPTPTKADSKKIAELGTSFSNTTTALHKVLDDVKMNYDVSSEEDGTKDLIGTSSAKGHKTSSARWLFKQYFSVMDVTTAGGTPADYSTAYKPTAWNAATNVSLPTAGQHTPILNDEGARLPGANLNGNNTTAWNPASQAGPPVTCTLFTNPSNPLYTHSASIRSKTYPSHNAEIKWDGGTIKWSKPSEAKTSDKYYPTMPFFRPVIDKIGNVMGGINGVDTNGAIASPPVYDTNLRSDIDAITNNPDMIYDYTYGATRKKYVILVTAGEAYDNPPVPFDEAGVPQPAVPETAGIAANRTPTAPATGNIASTVWYNDRAGDIDVVDLSVVNTSYSQNGSQTWNSSYNGTSGGTGALGNPFWYQYTIGAISSPANSGLWDWVAATSSTPSGARSYGATIAGAAGTSAMADVPAADGGAPATYNNHKGWTTGPVIDQVAKDLGKQLPLFYIYKDGTTHTAIDALNTTTTPDLTGLAYLSSQAAQNTNTGVGTAAGKLTYTNATDRGIINWTQEPRYKYETHDPLTTGYADASRNNGAAGGGYSVTNNLANHSNAAVNPVLNGQATPSGRATQINDAITKLKATLNADKASGNITDYEIFVIRVDETTDGLSQNVPALADKPANLVRTYFTDAADNPSVNIDGTPVLNKAIASPISQMLLAQKGAPATGFGYAMTVTTDAQLKQRYGQIMDYIINNDLDLITVTDQLSDAFELYKWQQEPYAVATYYDPEIAPDSGDGTDPYKNGNQWSYDSATKTFKWNMTELQAIDDPETPDEFTYYIKLRDGFSLTGSVYETSSMTYIEYKNIDGQAAIKYFDDEQVSILDGQDDPEKVEEKLKEQEFVETPEFTDTGYIASKASEGFKTPSQKQATKDGKETVSNKVATISKEEAAAKAAGKTLAEIAAEKKAAKAAAAQEKAKTPVKVTKEQAATAALQASVETTQNAADKAEKTAATAKAAAQAAQKAATDAKKDKSKTPEQRKALDATAKKAAATAKIAEATAKTAVEKAQATKKAADKAKEKTVEQKQSPAPEEEEVEEKIAIEQKKDAPKTTAKTATQTTKANTKKQ